jgi:predicted SAM-dependent methyltransferase
MVQIGTGDHELPGWLNTDAWPRSAGVVYVDLTESLPFPPASVDYIFSEHTIEHVDYERALAFARECRRVLAPGGSLRLATPNLLSLVSLYGSEPATGGPTYVAWAIGYNHLPETGDPRCFVLNNFMRAWGHRFIYDPDTLFATLREAGLANLRLVVPGESADPNLQNLESHGKTIGEEFNRFETMVIEADAT